MELQHFVRLFLLWTFVPSCAAAPTIGLQAPDRLKAALVSLDGGYLYLFTGGLDAIQISLKYQSEGRLRDVNTLWAGLDAQVDAAVNYTLDGAVYFFNGGEYRSYKNNVVSGPHKISDGWPNIFRTGGVDAAGNKDGKSYFFKGCNFWTPYETIGSDGHLLHDLTTLNLPCDIDAAWEYEKALVLSKDDQYWIWGGTAVTGPFTLTNLLDVCTWNSSLPVSVNLPDPLVCNGDPRLCSLRLDKVTLPGSHNAGSGFAGSFTSPPCFYQNHELSILEQLRFGIRYLDVDSCWTECGNNLGTCHAGNCAGLICSMLVQIKTFLVQNPTEVVMVNFNHDMTNHDLVIPELVRQIEEQLSPFLNSDFRETGQWPTLEQAVTTGKRLFVIITTQVTTMSFYPQKRWIIDEVNMASTYTLVIVLAGCDSVVNSTRDKCTELASRSLLEVSVFGGFGACIDDMMSRCDDFLFASLEACSYQRISANKAPNVLMVDFPALSPPDRNVLTAVRQQNARNLLAFENKCHVILDAAVSINMDGDSMFFSGNRILRYNIKDKVQKSSELIDSFSSLLPSDIDSAISGRYWGRYSDTYFLKGCNCWTLRNGSVTGPILISDIFPGLECDIDAAVGIDSTAYFFKGCNYWTYKRSWKVDGPNPIDYYFDGLPCDIDAALNFDDKAYFFQNNNNSGSYWLYSYGAITKEGTSILDWNIDPVVCEN